MKNDFKKMEEDMDNLSVKISAITAFNDKISNTLQRQTLTNYETIWRPCFTS